MDQLGIYIRHTWSSLVRFMDIRLACYYVILCTVKMTKHYGDFGSPPILRDSKLGKRLKNDPRLPLLSCESETKENIF